MTELLLFILAVLIYWRSLDGPPIFDDHDMLHGQYYRQFRLPSWALLQSKGLVVPVGMSLIRRNLRNLRPLTTMSYVVNGLYPGTLRGFHVTNVLAHWLNALVAGRILAVLGFGDVAVVVGQLAWLVSPLAVHGVAYLTGRAAVLSCLFGMMGLWAMLTGHPWWSLVALGAAVLSKEDGIAFALTIGAFGWWANQPLWWLPVAVPLAFAVWRWRDVRGLMGGVDENLMIGGLPGSLPQPEHGLTVYNEVLLHLPGWIIGIGLSPYHGSGVRMTLRRNVATALVLMMMAFWPSLVMMGLFIGPWLVYLACRVPDALMEYRHYAALLGVAILAAMLGPWILPILAALAVRSFLYAASWRDPEAFWRHAIRSGIGEKSRAYQEVGAHVKTMGRLAASTPFFEKALELNPKLAPARSNLAWNRVQVDRNPGMAAALLEDGVKHNPNYPYYLDLGRFYELAKQPEKALDAYQRGLKAYYPLCYRRPSMLWNRIGMLLYRQGRKAEAAEWCRKALDSEEFVPFRFNCSVIANDLGRKEELKQLSAKLPKPIRVPDHLLMEMLPVRPA